MNALKKIGTPQACDCDLRHKSAHFGNVSFPSLRRAFAHDSELPRDYRSTTLLTTKRVCAREIPSLAHRGASPETSRRRSEAWRPAAAACNRLPREARDPARQALRPGCEELAARIRKATARRCRTAGAEGDGSAAPRPKTATVERREASVPRHGTQGASLGAWPAASCAGLTGVPLSTRTFLGAPPLFHLNGWIV